MTISDPYKTISANTLAYTQDATTEPQMAEPYETLFECYILKQRLPPTTYFDPSFNNLVLPAAGRRTKQLDFNLE